MSEMSFLSFDSFFKSVREFKITKHHFDVLLLSEFVGRLLVHLYYGSHFGAILPSFIRLY